jgi:hypothetical protein
MTTSVTESSATRSPRFSGTCVTSVDDSLDQRPPVHASWLRGNPKNPFCNNDRSVYAHAHAQ